jgi:hypothetical protein
MEVQMQLHEQFLMIKAMKESHARPLALEPVNWWIKLASKLIDLAKRLEPNLIMARSISELKSNR